MSKRVAAKNRNVAPVISHVTTRTRALVDRLAKHEKVSISEIGRRAIAQYAVEQVVEQEA